MHLQCNIPIASIDNIRIVHFKRQLHAHYFTEPLGLSRQFESLSVLKTIKHLWDLHLSVLFRSKWSTSLWPLSHLSYSLRLEAKKNIFFFNRIHRLHLPSTNRRLQELMLTKICNIFFTFSRWQHFNQTANPYSNVFYRTINLWRISRVRENMREYWIISFLRDSESIIFFLQIHFAVHYVF